MILIPFDTAMILYKYYSCDENTFKSLSVPGIWCHRADMMNDPFECLAGADFHYGADELGDIRNKLSQLDAQALNSRIQKIVEANDSQLIDILNQFRRSLVEKFAFCSLSESYDDILMWSHYANGHKGCVIGIEFPEESVDYHLQKVSYSDEPIALDLNCIADLMAGNDNQENVRHFLNSMSVKGEVWEREREWRIWRSGPSYWRYEKKQIREVYFGTKMAPESKMIALKLLDLPEEFLIHEMELKFSPLRLEC